MNLATYGCQIDAKYENQVIIKKEIQSEVFYREQNLYFLCFIYLMFNLP